MNRQWHDWQPYVYKVHMAAEHKPKSKALCMQSHERPRRVTNDPEFVTCRRCLHFMREQEKTMTDKTLRELQSSLPWTAHYHRDFRASPMTHKDLGHALLHVHKAGGKLAAIVNDAEHGGVAWDDPVVRAEVAKYAADFVICALRIANTCPDGVIDLQRAVEDRLTAKNNQLGMEAKAIRNGS